MNRRFGLRRFYRVPLFLLVQVLAIAVVAGAGVLTDHRGAHPSSALPTVGSSAHRLAPAPSPSSTLIPDHVASSTTPGTDSTANAAAHITAKVDVKSPTHVTAPKHKTPTTTTTAAPGAASSHPLALGFAVFQPTGQFQSYQSAVGKLPNFVEWYQSWPAITAVSSTAPLFWGSQEQTVQADKLTPIISWSTDAIPLNTIVDGATDGEDAAVLAPAATLAKSYSGTLYIRLDWEMNGSWSQWNPGNAAQAGQDETAATFVAMWQHVVTYFRAAGVTNVKWVWSPNIDNTGTTLGEFYPGDGFVDDVALDGYNYAYVDGDSWSTPQQVFGPSYAALEKLTHKPVIIAETASVEANSAEASQGLSKALWMQQLSAYLPTLSNVVALCWFDQPALVPGYGTVDFSVNTSTGALASWEKYFVNNPEYQGKLP
jgi:beta-mannanase